MSSDEESEDDDVFSDENARAGSESSVSQGEVEAEVEPAGVKFETGKQ
jgi:hypothetical protein